METKEKDKKYSVILGIMILLFLIIVGIAVAWGLGYVHIGIANKEEILNDNSNQGISIEKDNKNKLGNAYIKYSNIEWQRKTIFDATTWGQRVYINDSTGKVVIETVDWQTDEITSTKTIENIEGKPKYVAGTLTCGGYDRSAVLTYEGDVYLQKYISDSKGKITDYNFVKLDFEEKIVDIAAIKETRARSCFAESFYFLTETGRLLNIEGESYEERNGNYKTIIGNIDMPIYVYNDNTIGYILINDCDRDLCKENRDKFKYNGNPIVAKKIFITERELDVNSNEFEKIGHSPTYTAYILTDMGDLLYINDYQFDKLVLKLHSNNVKNIEAISNNGVKVIYLDGTSKIFENADIEI